MSSLPGSEPWWRGSATAESLDVAALVLAAALWLASMWTTELVIGPYGLAGTLSPLWYASALLAFAGLVTAASRRLYAYATGHAVLLVMIIALPPFLLEKTVRFPYVFNSYRYADQLNQTGRIDFGESYLAWPGWHIVSAATVDAGGWDAPSFLQWASLLLGVTAASASVMLLARMTGGGRLFWASVAAAVPLSTGLSYPLPGTMAGILWIMVLVLVADEYLGEHPPSLGRRVVLLVLIAGVVVSHLLTTIAMVASLFAILGATFLYQRGPRAPTTIGIVAGVFMLGYLFYVATETTAQLLPRQIRSMLDLERLFGSTVTATGRAVTGGSDEHTRVVLVRIGYVVGASSLALASVVSAAMHRRLRERSVWFPASVAASGGATVVMGPYGGEIISRAYTFSALAVAVLVGRLIHGRGGLVVLPVLALAVALAPVNAYGNEMYDHVRPHELAADNFVAEHVPAPYEVVGMSRTLVGNWQPERPPESTVRISGPLYAAVQRFLGSAAPVSQPDGWQYDNGDLRVSIEAAR